ncbi:MAG: hypothetical protein DCF16_10095 [Alphaproteobacteria bacterium]|nr:MAG: hypothetical protein DCF16_10095 [Alphaproteobacteria bacterium]
MLNLPLHHAAGLDLAPADVTFRVMLQHNSARAGRRAHLAHAAVVGLHTLCCGLPALVLLAAALSGATSGVALLSDSFGQFHEFMHRHELWILVLSAALVAVGGWLEARSRRNGHSHAFPWLFALSVLCFFANVAIILLHRG